MLPPAYASPLIMQQMTAGERVLWYGRPDPFVSMMSKGGAAIFALAWLAITVSVAANTDPRVLTTEFLVSLLFVFIGVFILSTPLLEYCSALRTMFLITDRRLIVASKSGRSIKSVKLSKIGQVEREAKRGKISLRIPTSLINDGDGGQRVDYIFLHGLQDGERAYQLLTAD